jgi:site-specific recombinase XerD
MVLKIPLGIKMHKINTLFDSLEGAYAPNTIRSYRSDYMHYSNWCQEYHCDPFNIHEEQFADYILRMGNNLTVATIQRRVASLSSIFSLTKSANPTKEPVVILTFKKLRRKFGKPQKQATPLTYDILTKLKDVCSDDIAGLRNKLLLQLGYETMRRRSEICQFKFEDLQHLGNHKHALLLRRSKTDQYNQGKIIPISGELSEMISKWSLAIDQDSGYILRSFKRNLSTKSSLTPASINHILKSLQKQAGLNQIGELSGHSFRVGAALDLLNKNIPLEKIMLRGGWKSETSAMRYLQSWNDSNWLIIN